MGLRQWVLIASYRWITLSTSMYVRTFLDLFMLCQLSGCIVVIKCSTLECDAMTALCQVTREVKAFLAP